MTDRRRYQINIGAGRNSGDIIPPKSSGALVSLTEGSWTFSTGAHCGMEQQKVKFKTLDTTVFSKMLIVRIILKLKKLGVKNL